MVVFNIHSKISGQNYVGSCRSDIFERWELYIQAAEAGLDYPLYREIREHGEANFDITELDFAEDISELRERELLHTVELKARSLRSYKFGRTDAVVKRHRQADIDRAWMKDLEDEPRAGVQQQAETKRPAKKPTTVAESAKRPTESRSKVEQPSPMGEQPSPMDEQPRPMVEQPRAMVEQAGPALGTVEKDSVKPARPNNQDAQVAPEQSAAVAATPLNDESQALLAAGAGLLVRTLDKAQALSAQWQQAASQTALLSSALKASEQALKALDVQQRVAEERAREAQAALAASAEANRALGNAQRQLHEQGAALAELMAASSNEQGGFDALQAEITALLSQLKAQGAGKVANREAHRRSPVSEQKTGDKPAAAPAPRPAPASASAPEIAPTGGAQAHPASSADDEPSADEMAAQEARMVNGLKGLGALLDAQRVETSAEEEASTPVRAWVAPAKSDGEAPRVLEKTDRRKAVVHRRKTKALGAIGSALSEAGRGGRKTLSIRSGL
ncbi:GIY-YIG nuclease family protein [Motiliproteus sp. SC1-56]|uniref:GIY-YIG nuclease family protein n=1 Tax=Motiliproteus sp. SC1-56 TaxID=2799565 RepID=UPI001A8E82DE|nr:GIY-YIG nuclease family protein [Motiliproteus sp. SC1-56]